MDLNKHLKQAKILTTLLDTQFKIFGISFGLDPILDLVPGVGSILGAISSLYIFWIASQLKVPREVYIKMIVNILIDFIIGEIPLLGIILDTFFKSNVKNFEMLQPYNRPKVYKAQVLK